MNSSFCQLRNFTTGALKLSLESGTVYFDRYTPEQAAAFYEGAPLLAERAVSTAGIRLDFHTDASTLAVEHSRMSGNWSPMKPAAGV